MVSELVARKKTRKPHVQSFSQKVNEFFGGKPEKPKRRSKKRVSKKVQAKNHDEWVKWTTSKRSSKKTKSRKSKRLSSYSQPSDFYKHYECQRK